jgi:5,10-methylenetetrahydromethanopterin reductase
MAEKHSFDSIWIPEDYYYRDVISRLSVLAYNTERIKLATGVINPATRSPPLIAMTMANIDEISKGRTILGLGPSVRLWLYEHHRGKINHITAIRECIEIVRDLLTSKKIRYEGKLFNLQNIQLGFKPYRKSIPIYLGVMGPKMLQLAGRIADGVLLTACATPEYVKYALENIKIGAEKAERDIKDINIAGYIVLSISEDYLEAIETVKHTVAYMIALPQFNPILKLSGLLDREEVEHIRKAAKSGDYHEAVKYVNEELIDAFSVSGSPKECKQKIRKFTDSGIKLPILLPQGEEKNYKIAINSFGKHTNSI